ncbi:uncharacterized protein [Watersipora subatra]|uniref:uncharacterized protein n=1 Tax=Watersipora subatra TaxID=2589382 RepID=UPI00355B6955
MVTTGDAMRNHFSLHLYKYGMRYMISVALIYVFIKWMNREPRMPDPLLPSEVDAIELFGDQLHGDGLHFTWAHAVNSQAKLDSALQAGVNGIEADVILKNEGTIDQELLPIMAHPPALRSDITLRLFLHQTIVGDSMIKLDFKSISSVELSLQILSQLSDQIKVPVWLNADILKGPGNVGLPPVDATSFLKKIETSQFKHYTLSLGWTSSVEVLQSYSWEHVYDMYKLLKPRIVSSQSITFPVNAALLRGSIIPLKWLCEQFDSSLTIWQSQAHVEISELVYARIKFPKNKIYYDLQEETMAKFIAVANDNRTLKEEHRVREAHSYATQHWILKVSNKEQSSLLVGDDVIWLSGPDAQVISSRKVKRGETFSIKGSVTFLPRTGDKSNLQIFLFGRGDVMNHPSGIRCSIDSKGRMVIASDHLKTSQLYKDEQLDGVPAGCIQFHITVSDNNIEFLAAAPESNCHVMQDLMKPKTLQVTLNEDELVVPFPVIIRNSRNEGYAIAEQMKLEYS